MARLKRFGSAQEVMDRRDDLESAEEKFKRDRLHLSLGAAQLIVDALAGTTRDIGLYTTAMYAVHGPTQEQESWFKKIADKLDGAQPNDIVASTDAAGLIRGGFRMPQELPTDGVWNFDVRFCYENSNNGLPAFVGDLMLHENVALNKMSFRTLSKKWLNHGYEGNIDEPYCSDVVVGLPHIAAEGISKDSTRYIKEFL